LENKEEIWIKKVLLEWYKTYGRGFPWRNPKINDPYKILVTELLLQKTKAEMVTSIWETFFKEFPTIQNLATADENSILEIIGQLGLSYRAKRLRQMAEQIVRQYNGKIPSHFHDLLRLYGVGPYIASSVLCFAFNKRQPIVDVNIMRLMNRFKGFTDEISVRNFLEEVLPIKKFKEFNWALIDLATLVCKPNKPLCLKCPLKLRCPKNEIDLSKWRILRKHVRNGHITLSLQHYLTKRRNINSFP
jgi:A/G-specific adenine glycosylase